MSVATASGYQLEAGSLALMENEQASFSIEALGGGADFGNPAPVSEVVRSLMRDGDLTTTTRDGNRIASFYVRVRGNSWQALADGEAMLLSEVDKPNTLTWRVPSGGPPTCFDVVRSWSEFAFEDLSEVLRQERIFRIFFECLPYGRSEVAESFTWTGYAKADPLTSSTGWSTVGGGTLTVSGGVLKRSGAAGSSVVAKKTLTLGRFLFIPARPTNVGATNFAGVTQVTVDGVVVDGPGMFEYYNAYRGHTFDTRRWAGVDASVEITIQAPTGGFDTAIYGLWRCGAPPSGAMPSDAGGALAGEIHRPLGVDAVSVHGTARALVHLAFTAPTGGAFVYTSPDPATLIRDRGAAEIVFSRFTVADAAGTEFEVSGRTIWFPEGDHATTVGFTDGQPLDLFPEKPWPQGRTWPQGLSVPGDEEPAPLGVQYAYPADPKAAVSFFQDSGAKNVISPSIFLPQGYHGGAVFHESHLLHPPHTGIAVLDQYAMPISTTVTYYPRWRHHAAR